MTIMSLALYKKANRVHRVAFEFYGRRHHARDSAADAAGFRIPRDVVSAL